VLWLDGARQGDGWGRTEQADIDAVDAEQRPVSRDCEVAGGDQLASRSRGDSVHDRDYRLRQIDDRLHHLRAGVERLFKIGATAVGVAAMRRHLLEVMPAGKQL